MTKLFEQAIKTIRELPEEDQDIAAQFLLGFANRDAQDLQLIDEQLAQVEQARQEVRAGKIATDKEMEDVWRKFNR